MAYEVMILCHLHMPLYFLGTFTEYPYVKTNFPQEVITKIERRRSGVEVELANDYSLKFNSKGKFVGMDD